MRYINDTIHIMNQLGFISIPVLIWIFIGTAVVGGGGYYVVKEQEKRPVPNNASATTTQESLIATSTDTDTASSTVVEETVPVEVVDSTLIAETEPAVQTPVTDTNIPKETAIIHSIDTDTQNICNQASSVTHAQTFEALAKLCTEVEEPFEEKEDFDETVKDIQERWDYYQNVLEMEAVQEKQKQRDSDNDQTEVFSEDDCLEQKENLVSEVDNTYLDWYDDWQNARAELDSCYNSNPVPYCDKQMTEINIEWQEKISNTMKSYQDELTLCALDQRYYNDVSDVVSSSY